MTKLEENSRISKYTRRKKKKCGTSCFIILSSIMTPRYLTWSFCSREEIVRSLVGKIMIMIRIIFYGLT